MFPREPSIQIQKVTYVKSCVHYCIVLEARNKLKLAVLTKRMMKNVVQQTRNASVADRSNELDEFEEHGEIFKIRLTEKSKKQPD